MNQFRVAIPIKKGKRIFHLEKGKPWSLIEHIILFSVSEKEKTVLSLSEESELPRRLVLECVIRLMRAGWIEILQKNEAIYFKTTKRGNEVVQLDELPYISEKITRWVGFIIDQVSGTLFRNREFNYYDKHFLINKFGNEKLIFIQAIDNYENINPNSIFDTLLEDDETFLSTENSGEKMLERFAIATVRDGQVEGLPDRAPSTLKEIIVESTKIYSKKSAGVNNLNVYTPPSDFVLEKENLDFRNSPFKLSDIILDGDKHKKAILETIDNSKERLIIHSTFISKERFDDLYNALKKARNRGVKIDILWGEDDDKPLKAKTQLVVNDIKKELIADGIDSGFVIHNFSTKSHSKFIFSDDGNGNYFSIFGSCNWLCSNFDSFEASVRLRGVKIVSEIASIIAEMSCGPNGHVTRLANELTGLASKLRLRDEEEFGSTGDLSLVFGADHGAYMRKARDESVSNIFVTSHRLGASNRTAVFIPAVTAAEKKAIKVKLFFGRISDEITNTLSSSLTQEASKKGVSINPVSKPRLHAKILGWDNDHLVISSQNWLSADPSDSSKFKEIGVYINYSNVSKTTIEQFEFKLGS